VEKNADVVVVPVDNREVRLAVTVEVAHGNPNGIPVGTCIAAVRPKGAVAVAQDDGDGMVTKNCEIEFAIAVEVSGCKRGPDLIYPKRHIRTAELDRRLESAVAVP
jgi:hypothetical protein